MIPARRLLTSAVSRVRSGRAATSALLNMVPLTNLLEISGTVMDGPEAFPGVTVMVGNSPALTDSNGNYSILVTAGTYILTPKPIGPFNPGSANVTLTASSVAGVNFMATNVPTTVTNNVTNHVTQFYFSVVPTFSYRIQAATNLVTTNGTTTNWVDIATNTATSNTFIYFLHQPQHELPAALLPHRHAVDAFEAVYPRLTLPVLAFAVPRSRPQRIIRSVASQPRQASLMDTP